MTLHESTLFKVVCVQPPHVIQRVYFCRAGRPWYGSLAGAAYEQRGSISSRRVHRVDATCQATTVMGFDCASAGSWCQTSPLTPAPHSALRDLAPFVAYLCEQAFITVSATSAVGCMRAVAAIPHYAKHLLTAHAYLRPQAVCLDFLLNCCRCESGDRNALPTRIARACCTRAGRAPAQCRTFQSFS